MGHTGKASGPSIPMSDPCLVALAPCLALVSADPIWPQRARHLFHRSPTHPWAAPDCFVPFPDCLSLVLQARVSLICQRPCALLSCLLPLPPAVPKPSLSHHNHHPPPAVTPSLALLPAIPSSQPFLILLLLFTYDISYPLCLCVLGNSHSCSAALRSVFSASFASFIQQHLSSTRPHLPPVGTLGTLVFAAESP